MLLDFALVILLKCMKNKKRNVTTLEMQLSCLTSKAIETKLRITKFSWSTASVASARTWIGQAHVHLQNRRNASIWWKWYTHLRMYLRNSVNRDWITFLVLWEETFFMACYLLAKYHKYLAFKCTFRSILYLVTQDHLYSIGAPLLELRV